MLDWTTTKEEMKLMSEIMDNLGILYDVTRLHLMMTLTAAHKNGCELDLESMAEYSRGHAASKLHVMHDVVKLENHINKDTGEIEGGFWPRFAKHQ